MSVSSAAWVPDDDPERDWSIAAGLGVAWVDARCREEGASAVLVTNALNRLGVPELDDFERRHTRTSRRAGRARVGPGTGPVLSYVPYAEELEFAMDLARGSSLAVVETRSFPLAGWAARFEAWDLVRNAPTPPLPEAINEVVERLAFYGNNGFSDPFGKKMARSILTDLGGPTGQQRELLVGAVLAAGVSARGTTNLGP
jgi:hypothetical protein